MHPESRQQVVDTLAYFDVHNFVDRITCPIIVNIGLNDDVCPPETGYAVYERIGTSNKKLYPYDGHGHDSNSYEHGAIINSFLDGILQPKPVAA